MLPSGMMKIFKLFAAFCETKRAGQNFTTHGLVLIIIVNLINLTFLIYGAITQPSIPSYFLMIFITNLMTYCVYYITLKVVHKEKFGLKPLLFGLLGMGCWAPALYFYNVKQRTTNTTPALSRNMNADCSMLSLFDYHDIWHIFSAGKSLKRDNPCVSRLSIQVFYVVFQAASFFRSCSF